MSIQATRNSTETPTVARDAGQGFSGFLTVTPPGVGKGIMVLPEPPKASKADGAGLRGDCLTRYQELQLGGYSFATAMNIFLSQLRAGKLPYPGLQQIELNARRLIDERARALDLFKKDCGKQMNPDQVADFQGMIDQLERKNKELDEVASEINRNRNSLFQIPIPEIIRNPLPAI